MKIAIIGASGLVGRVILQVLEESNIFSFLEHKDIIAVASAASFGKELIFKNHTVYIKGLTEAIAVKPEIAIFSAGAEVSLNWAKEFCSVGTTVIDNSSAWRKNPDVPLVVPEINIDKVKPNTKLVANPNCSTIQMVLALAPLHKRYRIKRIVISTYQSVTGTGAKAVKQLENERAGIMAEKVYPYKIDLNIIPHGGNFMENGYTTEELKLIDETRKILDEPDLKITATVARVPVLGGHSESVNVQFENDFDIKDIRKILNNAPGIKVQDNPSMNIYPMPINCKGKNEVFVGRIRRDESSDNSLNMWIVADNTRKGAATNAIQIAEYIYSNFMI
jgi:aspartate-semialdehyde dehydrogenase